jgi:hypothetical protein
MSLAADLCERRKQAFIDLQGAKETLCQAQAACYLYLDAHPPKTVRLQEAYRNADGTFAAPHWDEVAEYKNHLLVDHEEVDDHIVREGEWTEVFHNREDDPRPGYRRVIEVTW